MFGWFKKTEYPERKRRIFKYFDGEKEVYADPMVLYKRFMAIGPELAIDIKVSRSQHKDAPKAHDSMLKRVCEVFNLKRANPFDMDLGGLGESEIPNVLGEFLAYIESEKKNLRPSVTLQTPMEASKPSSNGDLPTENSLASGSTENVSSIVEQEPLPTEQLSL